MNATAGDPAQRLAARAPVLLWMAFGLLTLMDGCALRALWWLHEPARGTVEKTVYEFDDATGHIIPRGVAWGYPMLPQPRWLTAEVLLLPPGFPVSVFTTVEQAAFGVLVYEDRTPLLVQVTRPDGVVVTLLRRNGEPVLEPMTTTPPPVAALLPLVDCVAPDAPLAWTFAQDAATLRIQTGVCSWELAGDHHQVTVDSYATSARLDVESPALQAGFYLRWWMLLLLLAASMVARLGLKNATWIGMDATATVITAAASLVTPLFFVIWLLKGAVGLALGAWAAWLATRTRRRLRVFVLGGVAAGVVAAVTVDPVWLAERYTVLLERDHLGEQAPNFALGRVASRIPANTTHLALGYSTVNGAALHRGAYAHKAWDAILAAQCGTPQTVYARHALDGGNTCLLGNAWATLSLSLPALKHRVFTGGFNDDLVPPPLHPGALVSLLAGTVPSQQAYPQPMAAWEVVARANLQPDRVASSVACAGALARAGAPLVHVQDVSSFDLGIPRRFGREAWVKHRKAAVEAAGGTYVDMRTLIPGESPVYFNDYVHPSEVGYVVMARALCPLLAGTPSKETP